MKYITDSGEMDWGDDGCLSSWITEFSHEKNDYFLNYRMMWNEMSGDIYRYEIGNLVVDIPSDMYIMIGDVYGNLDWVTSEEMINRSVDLVVINKDFKQWSLKQPKFVEVMSMELYWPRTKNIIPVVTGDSVLIFSEKDIYTKTQDMNITDLLV